MRVVAQLAGRDERALKRRAAYHLLLPAVNPARTCAEGVMLCHEGLRSRGRTGVRPRDRPVGQSKQALRIGEDVLMDEWTPSRSSDLCEATIRELLVELEQVEKARQEADRFPLRSRERAIRAELGRRRQEMATALPKAAGL
jgi:hypothetical protein